ncbi:peptidylprolyl isomerase [Alteromonas sp. D210916BOD_24]
MVFDPFTRCLLLGGSIFWLSFVFNGPSYLSPEHTIHISQAKIQQLGSRYRLLAGVDPSNEALQLLINDYVNEEIAYREAMALELEKDDTVVRRRLRQKLLFIAEGTESIDAPDQQTLHDWYLQHQSRFAAKETRTFTQKLFHKSPSSDKAWTEALQALDYLTTHPASSLVTEATLLPDTMRMATQEQASQIFGNTLAQVIFRAPKGSWQGPFESPFGVHLLFIEEIQDAYVPEFEKVAGQVESDWYYRQRLTRQQTYFEELRKGYRITVDDMTSGKGI